MPKPPTRMIWAIKGGEIVLDEDGCHLRLNSGFLEQPEAIALTDLYSEIHSHAKTGGVFTKPVPPTKEEVDMQYRRDYYEHAKAIMRHAIDDEIRG